MDKCFFLILCGNTFSKITSLQATDKGGWLESFARQYHVCLQTPIAKASQPVSKTNGDFILSGLVWSSLVWSGLVRSGLAFGSARLCVCLSVRVSTLCCLCPLLTKFNTKKKMAHYSSGNVQNLQFDCLEQQSNCVMSMMIRRMVEVESQL